MDKLPTEVWAVEYTTNQGHREVAVQPDLPTAVAWIDNLQRASIADPVLLRSDADFERWG